MRTTRMFQAIAGLLAVTVSGVLAITQPSGDAAAKTPQPALSPQLKALERAAAAAGGPRLEPMWTAETAEARRFASIARQGGADPRTIKEFLRTGVWVMVPVPENTPQPEEQLPEVVSPLVATRSASPTVASTGCSAATVNKKANRLYIGSRKTIAATYYLGQSFCFDSRRRVVTSVGQPYALGTVAVWASLFVDFLGTTVDGRLGPEYYAWERRYHGGVRTWRTGKFKTCAPGTPFCVNTYAWIHFYGHGDGTTYATNGIRT